MDERAHQAARLLCLSSHQRCSSWQSVAYGKGKNIISDWERFTKQKLDRPTPSLAKGFAVERGQFATKRRLSTLLVGKTTGWNRNRYILGNIKGGDRPNTWADQFSQKGTLPPNTKLVPTRNLKRDPRTGGPSYSAVKRLLNKAGSNPSGGTGTVFVGKPAQGIQTLWRLQGDSWWLIAGHVHRQAQHLLPQALGKA